jgi:maltose O-acetyltransferase
MSRSQRERMLSGESYDSHDPELLALAHRARALLADFAALPSTDAAARHRTLAELLGHVGAGVWIESPFFCDYGQQITIGDDSFINVNCVFLDAAPIQLGANVLVGPGVQLLTVSHPASAAERIVPLDVRHPEQAPYRTHARPIVVGDRVWLGAGSIVLPGVTIGANAVIGAASLVTGDIPPDCLAYGQPCRVQRSLGHDVAATTKLTPPAV